MATAGTLVALIGSRIEGLTRGFRQASNETRRGGVRINRELAKIDRSFARTSRRIGTALNSIVSLRGAVATLAGGTGLGLLIRRTAQYTDEISKQATAVGVSVEELQGFRQIFELAGGSIEAADRLLVNLNRRLGELRAGTGAAYSFLVASGNTGLLRDIQNAENGVEVLELLRQAYFNLPNQSDRSALLASFGGRLATPLQVAFTEGLTISGGTEQLRNIGGLISQETASEFEKFNDAFLNITKILRATFATSLVESGGIPALTDQLIQLAKTAGRVLPSIIQGFVGFVGFFSNNPFGRAIVYITGLGLAIRAALGGVGFAIGGFRAVGRGVDRLSNSSILSAARFRRRRLIYNQLQDQVNFPEYTRIGASGRNSTRLVRTANATVFQRAAAGLRDFGRVAGIGAISLAAFAPQIAAVGVALAALVIGINFATTSITDISKESLASRTALSIESDAIANSLQEGGANIGNSQDLIDETQRRRGNENLRFRNLRETNEILVRTGILQAFSDLGGGTEGYRQLREQNSLNVISGINQVIDSFDTTESELRLERATARHRALNEELRLQAEEVQLFSEQIGDSFSSLTDELINFADTGTFEFRRFLNSVLLQIAQATLDRQITQPLAEGFATFVGTLLAPTDTSAQAVRGVATGGFIRGAGTGTSDSILARLSNGEYVVRAASVRKFGTGFLDSVNRGMLPAFQNGGFVGSGSGGGFVGTVVNITNNTSAQITQEERTANDTRFIEVVIDEALNRGAQQITSGTGQLGNATNNFVRR